MRLGLPLLAGLALLCACRRPLTPEEYLRRERSYLRLGVDMEQEEKSVRHVLAQRKLSVRTELRGPGFVVLDAASFDERVSALRAITGRGVVLAEDAALDDLFVASSLSLLDRLPTSLGDFRLFAFARTGAGRDRGCVTLMRVLPDGSLLRAVLDVGTFGPRACVSDLARGDSGRLRAELSFPGLYAEGTPSLRVELAFQSTPLGQPIPLIPVAKIALGGGWLEAERARLASALPPASPFAQRHAVGVARAAVALLAGRSSEDQVAAYREAIGVVRPGTYSAERVADTLDYLEHGWLDPSGDEQVLAPEQSEAPPPSSAARSGDADAGAEEAQEGLVIEPDATTSP
jgi:hypothetical protein